MTELAPQYLNSSNLFITMIMGWNKWSYAQRGGLIAAALEAMLCLVVVAGPYVYHGIYETALFNLLWKIFLIPGGLIILSVVAYIFNIPGAIMASVVLVVLFYLLGSIIGRVVLHFKRYKGK